MVSRSSKRRDTVTELLHGHLVLVELEAVERLVVEVLKLGQVEVLGVLCVQLGRHLIRGVVQLLQKCRLEDILVSAKALCGHEKITYGNGEVVTASELGDLTNIPERCAHNNSLVSVLLVVVENALHRLDTRVFLGRVLLLGGSLEPVENAADEGRDEESAGLGGSNSLDLGEEEGKVAVDLVLLL